jgi:hypothetical protein
MAIQDMPVGDVSGHFALQGQLTKRRKKNVNAACPVLSGKARGGEAVTRSACTVGSLLMYMYTYSYTYSYTYRYVECPQELCAA